MEETVLVLGVVAEATAWWFVSSRGMDVWRVVTPVLLGMGVAAFVFGPPAWSPEVDPVVAALVGVGAGIAFYAATRAFVALGWWSGGAIAPLACHVVWTALMLSFPLASRGAISA